MKINVIAKRMGAVANKIQNHSHKVNIFWGIKSIFLDTISDRYRPYPKPFDTLSNFEFIARESYRQNSLNKVRSVPIAGNPIQVAISVPHSAKAQEQMDWVTHQLAFIGRYRVGSGTFNPFQ